MTQLITIIVLLSALAIPAAPPPQPLAAVIDILCMPAQAYRLGTLGCLTLAHLEEPCERHYLPEVPR